VRTHAQQVQRTVTDRPIIRGLWVWMRQGNVRQPRSWRPWWLLGLVEVVTYPRPHWRSRRAKYIPGCRGIDGFPARPAWMAVVG